MFLVATLAAAALDEVVQPARGESAWKSETKSWDHYWGYCDLVRLMQEKYVP
jgi:hypothetical protein